FVVLQQSCLKWTTKKNTAGRVFFSPKNPYLKASEWGWLIDALPKGRSEDGVEIWGAPTQRITLLVPRLDKTAKIKFAQ
ncbi:hypothetical protein, partial [Ligilactobacillus animalis]|uniref:hypothetical protein n=1 Tax=Ligilactobacillus animalis TaxID=1605 RepID=UPI003A520DF3